MGSPAKLASIPLTHLTDFAAQGPNPSEATSLWKASTLLHSDLPSASILTLQGASEGAEKLISRLKNAPSFHKAVLTDVTRSLRPIKLPRTFLDLCPGGKL